MLSERQIELLAAIIKEYIDSSIPVGSEMLVKKYNIKCSAATVRNEMARLLEHGFLEMEHASSGRVPSPMAYRFYINELVQENELPVLQEVSMKQQLWPERFEFDRLLKKSVMSLADATHLLAVATTHDGLVVHAGAVNILDHKEFWDINVTKALLGILDRHDLLEKILSKAVNASDINFLIGDELGIQELHPCVFIFSEYQARDKSGYIGVIGPSRTRYDRVIPAVRYTKGLLSELAGSW